MSLISIQNLTFSYDGNDQTIFDHVSFQFDTHWKLGFIGRNGRGKTTFLRLLQKEFSYTGTISCAFLCERSSLSLLTASIRIKYVLSPYLLYR